MNNKTLKSHRRVTPSFLEQLRSSSFAYKLPLPTAFRSWRPQAGQVFTGPYACALDLKKAGDWQRCELRQIAVINFHGAFLVPAEHLHLFLEHHSRQLMVVHDASATLELLQRTVGDRFDLLSLVDRHRVWSTSLLDRLISEVSEAAYPASGANLSRARTASRYLETRITTRSLVEERAQATWRVALALRARWHERQPIVRRSVGWTVDPKLEQQSQRWGIQGHNIRLRLEILQHRHQLARISTDARQHFAVLEEAVRIRSLAAGQLRQAGYDPTATAQHRQLVTFLEKVGHSNPALVLPRQGDHVSTCPSDWALLAETAPSVRAWLTYLEADDTVRQLCLQNPLPMEAIRSPYLCIKRTETTREFAAPWRTKPLAFAQPSPGYRFLEVRLPLLDVASWMQTLHVQFGGAWDLREIWLREGDFFRELSGEILQKPSPEITTIERHQCRILVRGLMAGMTGDQLMASLELNHVPMTPGRFQRWTASYFDLLPQMRKFLRRPPELFWGIADLLDLTPAQHTQLGGSTIHSDSETDLPSRILGGMAQKAFREPTPKTSSGRLYSEAELDWFWSRLETVLYRLPTHLQSQVWERRPSEELSKAVHRLVMPDAVVTASGYCQSHVDYLAARRWMVQGLAADAITLAMWALSRAGYQIAFNTRSTIMLQVDQYADLEIVDQRVSEVVSGALWRLLPEGQPEVVTKLWPNRRNRR